MQYLLCFSFYSNYKRLFTGKSRQAHDPLNILGFLWTITMGWICLEHIAGYITRVTYISNPEEVIDVFKTMPVAIAYGGVFAADTFFWLAALTTTVLILEALNRRTTVNWP
jgi:hypothetical protein